jgi:LacI family transcriptional regulator
VPSRGKSAEGAGIRVTSLDIAKETGVSQPTVSRALRGDPRVAEATAERVRLAAARLGYVRHHAASSLSSRRTDTVALLASDLNNPFYPQLVQALHGELAERGLRSLLLSDREGGAERLGELVRGGVVDGAIVATARLDADTRAALEATPLAVLVVREVPGLDRDTVVAENRAGAEAAAAALAELGHTRIAMISGPLDTSTGAQREEGFLAGLKDAGIGLEPELLRRGEYSHEEGRRLAAELLSLAAPPTAIFCGNDVVALGALDAAAAAEIAVSDRLSILGFDDIPQAGWETVGLATVRQPLEAMAARAVELFAERHRGYEGAARRIAFTTEVVRRRTLGRPLSAAK